MHALAIIGCAISGGAVGGFIGAALGFREGGDFNFAPVIYGPFGIVIGGFVGVVVGSTVFPR